MGSLFSAMPSQYDASDFVDTEYESAKRSPFEGLATAPGGDLGRPPSREEIDSKVSETQVKLAELKRAQEELERERALLEETRRRQVEFQTGREEMLHSLTRGLGILEEAEFAARRDAEQMAKSMVDLKEALLKIQSIQEENWTKDNFSMELTRAMTTIENARMEWNAARLKFPVLSGARMEEARPVEKTSPPPAQLADLSFGQLWKIGLAITWPLIVLGASIIALLLTRPK